MMKRRRAVVAVLLAVMTVLSACSDDAKVGSDVNLNVSDQAQERLGEKKKTTTTTAPAKTKDTALSVGQTTTTTAAPTTTTTAAPEKVAISITINGDAAGSTQFVPSAVRVYAGSLVEWVNKDSKPRSVVFDDNSYTTGMIAPGAKVRYRAAKAGQFNYTDGTRPYAVGTLEVIAR